jgi:tetratricopeptide (TPR) repeat protein
MSKKGSFQRFILNILLPIAIVAIATFYNTLLGLLALLIYSGIIIYNRRAGMMAFFGKGAYAKGDMEKAVKWYDRVIRSGAAKTVTKIEYGYIMLRAGDVEKSGEIFQKLLQSKLTDEEKAIVNSNYALLLWKTGHLDDAISLFEEIIPYYKTTSVYGSMGYLLIIKGDLDRALAFNQEAYEYNSSNKIILDNLGQTYYLKGENDKALEIYEKLIAQNPTFPEAYYNYSLALAKKGDYRNAYEYSQQALDRKLSFLSNISRDEMLAKSEEFKSMMEQTESSEITE